MRSPDPDPAPESKLGTETETETGTGAGLYIHVPFCTSVCPYCDFAVTIAGEERRRGWVEGILCEASMYSDLEFGFDTVYLGGGTPSAIEPDQLALILDGLAQHLEVDSSTTTFLEINPEDVSREKAAIWRQLGLRFVSLGVQSFDDADLAYLGRRHSAADAVQATEILCEAGFETVSVDLIYGLDGRLPDHWKRQLETALTFAIDHLSCYQLTVHEGTLLGRRVASGAVAVSEEAQISDLFFLTHELLSDAGFEGYEVSNFASAPEHHSTHNQKYWDHTQYLGLGPSSHSFVDGSRWWNRRKLRLWQKAVATGQLPIEEKERPSAEQFVLEALMLGFRTTAGVDLEKLRRKFGVDLLPANENVINRLTSSGHLEVDGTCLRPTLAGLAIADALARSFTV